MRQITTMGWLVLHAWAAANGYKVTVTRVFGKVCQIEIVKELRKP